MNDVKAKTKKTLMVVGGVAVAGIVAYALYEYVLKPTVGTAALYIPVQCPTGSYQCNQYLAGFGTTKCY